jgi:sigma-E factor negative regulatory protein RseA
MNDDPRQTLSVLLDGEGPQSEQRTALDAVLGDPAERARWERYHLIGLAIRGEPLHTEVRGVAKRVRAAIAAEDDGRVIPLQPRRRAVTGKRPSTRMIPLAASLAAGVAMLGVFLFSSDALLGPTGPGNAPRVAEAADPGIAREQFVNGMRWQNSNPVVRAKLNQLLVNHNERVPVSGMPGLVSYAAVVGYEARP